MTLLEVLVSIRQQLLQCIDENNRQEAEQLFTALAVLREISYQSPNRELTGIIIDLLDSARDVAMGVSWKSTIPTVEQLQAAFSEAS